MVSFAVAGFTALPPWPQWLAFTAASAADRRWHCAPWTKWRRGLWGVLKAVNEAAAGTFFDGTGAGNSRGVCGELQVLLVSFLRCHAHTPSLPAPFSDRCSSSRACRPRQGCSPRFGCRSRAWTVSFFCGCVILSRCVAHALPMHFPSHYFSPTQ